MKTKTIQLPEEHKVLEAITELQLMMEGQSPFPGTRIPKWAVVLAAVEEAKDRRSNAVDKH